MGITILSDESKVVMRRVALGGLAGAALLSVGVAADPYQPARTILIALCLVALLVASSQPRSQISRSTFVLVGVLSVWTLASALVAHPASSVFGVHGRYQGLTAMTLYLAAGIAGWWWAGRDMQWLVRLAAGFAIVQGVLATYQSLAGADPVGTIGNRVLLGAWLVVIVSTVLAGARAAEGSERWLLLASALVGSVGLGLAGSRGAWVGLILVALFFISTSSARKAWPLLVALLLVGVVAAGSGGEVARKLSPSSLSSGSAASRWEIWKSSGEMIADNPLFGVGPGRFLYAFPEYESVEHARLEGPDVRPDQAHGHLLQVAAESGILPAAALLGLLATATVAAVRGARRGDAAAMIAGAAFIGYVGQGIFGISAVETDAIGWLAGGVLIARAGRTAGGDQGPGASLAGAKHLRWIQVAGLVGAACVGIVSSYYLYADLGYSRGIALFEQGRFAESLESHRAAVSADPMVDVYRVGLSDPALYLDTSAQSAALEELDEGLRLEPYSYDLALAKARIINAVEGPTDATNAAYASAIALYPLGIEVRLEAAIALANSGRIVEASELAEDVLDTRPQDEQIRDIVEGMFGGT